MDTVVLDATYGQSEGFAQIVVGDFIGAVDKRKLKIAKSPFFAWPADKKELETFVAAHEDRDVYFSTTLFSRKKRSAETATVTNVVYVDADECPPEKFLVEPSLVVSTSPGRYQCYWFLDEEVPTTEASGVARKMCVHHAEDKCDPSGWIMAKLMRVPGTTHNKTRTPHPVEEISNTGVVYSLEEVNEPYKKVRVLPRVKIGDEPLPADLPDLYDTINKLNAEDFELFQYEPDVDDDWSSLRWKLSLNMLKGGFSTEEIFVVIQSTKFNKYARDKRPDADLWREVKKAAATYAHEVSVFEAHDDFAPERTETPDRPEFLNSDERSSLPYMFPDDFEDWVHSRSPLASRKYARFLSFMVLANVYGGFAFIEPQMGPMSLNLWGLMLGPSSELKKTTVLSLARTVQRAWEIRLPDEQKGFDIGSDFTPEGLNRVLSERDGLVSFIHRDEISGFFQETFHKSYLAGSVERLTALFDGEVLRTMRANANNSQTQNATTILNFLGLGIESHTADSLTSHHFQSGFLPRFLWCVDDSPEWTPDRETIGQGALGEQNASDPKVMEFVNRFTQARLIWDQGTGVRKPIYLTEPALMRLNQFALDTKYLVRGSELEALVEPSRVRIIWAVWKAAALLAMNDFSKQIELEHLLYAIREAEIWFADMLRMARNVNATDHERRMEEIVTWIRSQKGSVSSAKVYRQFAHLRKGETDEHLAALRAQGRVRFTEDRNYEVRD